MQGDYISTGGYENKDTWGAIFGRINYNFREKYFIEGNIRRDASSRFYNDNKYATFPSGSVGWIVTKENFLSGFKPLSYLKLRGSYGQIGNSSLNDPASYLNFLSPMINSVNVATFGDPRTGYPIYVVARPANPDLKWERDIDFNVGFDSYWFKSSLYLNAEIYQRKAKDLLYTDNIGREELGIPAGQKLNLGQISNKGWEATVGYRNKSTSKFKYDASVNFSHNTPYLDSYGLTGEPVLGTAQGNYRLSEELQGPFTKTEVGQEIGRYWGYQVLQVFQNQSEVDSYIDKSGNKIQPDAKPGDFKYQDTNGDGILNDKDRVYMGSRNPKLEMGLNLKVEYKGFDFSLMGYGRFGHQVLWFSKKFHYQGALGANIYEGALGKAWNGEGTSNSNPRFVKDGTTPDLLRFNSWFLEKGDYFRLNNIQLGYTIPSAWIPKIKKIRVYVNAQNLVTFTKYPGINPEIFNSDLPINANGVDISQYPVKKTIIAGVNISL
jgi:TonB-linked SusC/RagA family outer membrane protein